MNGFASRTRGRRAGRSLGLVGAVPLLLGAVAAAPAHAAASQGPTAYVVNTSSDSVSEIDGATNAVAGTIKVGGNTGVPELTNRPVLASPDGRTLFTLGGYDDQTGEGVLSIIDAATGRIRADVPLGYDAITMAVSPDSRYVYVALQVKIVKVDVQTGAMVAQLPLKSRPLVPSAIVVSPDGSKLYVATRGSDWVWAIDTASLTVDTIIHTGYADTYSLTLSPDGKELYAASRRNVGVIDTATDTPASTHYVGQGIASVTLSPDGSTLYAVLEGAGAHDTVAIVDTATFTDKSHITFPTALGSVVLVPGSTRAFAFRGDANGAGDVYGFDTVTHRITSVDSVGQGPQTGAVSPDGRWLYVANAEKGTVTVIDAATGAEVATLTVGAGPDSLDFVDGGRRVMVANRISNTVSEIDAASMRVVRTVHGLLREPQTIALSPDGRQALLGGQSSGSLRLVDAVTGQATGTYVSVPGGEVTAAMFSPDGERLYVASNGPDDVNGTTRALTGYFSTVDAATGKVVSNVQFNGYFASAIVLSANGRTAYVPMFGPSLPVGFDNVAVFDTVTGKLVKYIGVHDVGGSTPAMSADGSKLYVCDDGELTYINTKTNALGTVLSTTCGQALAVSPDGTKLYMLGASDVSVLDTTDYSLAATIPAPQPVAAAFAPGGGTLYVVNNTAPGTVTVIDTASEQATASVNVGNYPDAIAVH